MSARFRWPLLFALACVPLTTAQRTLDPGSLVANVYSNNSLGLTWEFPKEWVVQKHEGTSAGDGKMVLLKLSAGDDSVVLAAENHDDALGFSSGYSDALKADLEKNKWKSFGSRSFRSMGGGVGALEDHFSSEDAPTRYLSIACGALRGYELKFTVEAKTPDHLEELARTLQTFKVRPDWSSGESIEPPRDPSKPRMIRISEGVSEKLLIKREQPTSPKDPEGKSVHGSVVMVMHLNTLGHVRDLYVLGGDPILASAAVQAASHWEYKPFMLNGDPINVETQVTVNFE
jgi:hypothetical protein